MALNEETQALYDAAQGNAGKPNEGEATPSLAEHEATFSNAPRIVTETPSPGEASDDAAGPLSQPRHRARSQSAKTEDVEAIAKLTKRLRDAEAAAGISVEREDGESDRVYNLRRRAVLAEALAKPKTEAPKPAPRPVAPPQSFDEAEPQIEQFASAPDPYTAWQRALGAYDRRKEAAEARAEAARGAIQQQGAMAAERKRQAYAGFNERVNAFKAATADYESTVRACERPATYLMETAIVNDPDGPRYVYELAKRPDVHDEIFMLTDGKPVTHETVAAAQRLMKSRMPVAPTGSTAPAVRQLAPRPPNPVRTVPSAHLPNKAPGDTASLSDHEAFYGNGRRR